MAEDSSHFMVPSWVVALSILIAVLLSRRISNAGLLPYVIIIYNLFGRESPVPAIVLAFVWGGWCVLLLVVTLNVSRLAVGAPSHAKIYRYAHLGVFLPFLIIARPGIKLGAEPGPFVAGAMNMLWDAPLVQAALVCRSMDYRLIAPFFSQIDSNLAVGSMPMAQDVEFLREKGVSRVINMCREWPGPELEYETAGITQLRLPTYDTAAPMLSDLQKGIEFAQSAPKESVVFVHCKGGIGRAATMAISLLMKKNSYGPEKALAILSAKRNIVSSKILGYPVVQKLHHLLTGDSAQQTKDPSSKSNNDEL